MGAPSCREMKDLQRKFEWLEKSIEGRVGHTKGFHVQEVDVRNVKAEIKTLVAGSSEYKDLCTHIASAIEHVIKNDEWGDPESNGCRQLYTFKFKQFNGVEDLQLRGLEDFSPIKLPSICWVLQE